MILQCIALVLALCGSLFIREVYIVGQWQKILENNKEIHIGVLDPQKGMVFSYAEYFYFLDFITQQLHVHDTKLDSNEDIKTEYNASYDLQPYSDKEVGANFVFMSKSSKTAAKIVFSKQKNRLFVTCSKVLFDEKTISNGFYINENNHMVLDNVMYQKFVDEKFFRIVPYTGIIALFSVVTGVYKKQTFAQSHVITKAQDVTLMLGEQSFAQFTGKKGLLEVNGKPF